MAGRDHCENGDLLDHTNLCGFGSTAVTSAGVGALT
jgi:hypothetical protein